MIAVKIKIKNFKSFFKCFVLIQLFKKEDIVAIKKTLGKDQQQTVL